MVLIVLLLIFLCLSVSPPQTPVLLFSSVAPFTLPLQGGFCAPFPHLAICIKVTEADWGGQFRSASDLPAEVVSKAVVNLHRTEQSCL